MIKLMTTLMAATALVSCGTKSSAERGGTFTADTALTAQEKEARTFTPEVMWKMGRISSSTLSPDGQKVVYALTYYDVAENKPITSIWMMNSDGTESRQLTDHSGNDNSPQFSSDGQRVYFLSNRGGSSQVWSIECNSGAMVQLTHLESDVNGYGVSPGDHSIWFTQEVKTQKVASSDFFPELDKSQARIYDDLMVRHWDQWEDGMYSHIFVAILQPTGILNPVDITSGAKYDSPTAPYYDHSEITWNRAGDALAYTSRKLTGYEYSISTNTDIYQYSLVDSSTFNITTPLAGYDKYPVYSANNRYMAWQSMERAGNESDKNRLMLIDLDYTSKKRYMTQDFDYNTTNLQFDEKSENIYFISPMEATRQICRLNIESGKIDVLTSGQHDYISLCVKGDKMIAERCDMSHAAELFAIDMQSGAATQITRINQNIYDNMDMGKVEKRWIKTTDGKDMLAWVILPPGFDASKRYPTLLYCQGGPQDVVSQFWSYRWNFQLMAAQGYVVVAPNRRGLPSFGQQWLDQISGDYAGQCQRDLISAIDDLAKEPWVDNERLGSVGASFGGYSVFFQAGNHNKRFKALIAHCGIYDLESFYGATEELWFPNNDLGGPYWQKDNATAQRSYANSPHKFAAAWDTPILIITGEKDYRIPYTQSLEAFTAARAQGIPSRLVSFQDEGHIILKPQNSLVWNREFFAWLDKYLK